MPRNPAAAKSLFAALPMELKASLRSQPLLAVQDIGTAAEPIVVAEASTSYLPTQPRSSNPPSPEAPVIQRTLPRPPKRAFSASSPSTSQPPPKKITQRPRKPIKAWNAFLDHPWDCTGLVPRYEKEDNVPLDLRKYFHQRHFFFHNYTTLPILIDHTGWFSVTPQAIAERIAERCRGDVVLDAFCGIGGNAIELARTCERGKLTRVLGGLKLTSAVIAMDNDITRLRLARHNALHSGVADRIEFVLGDYVAFARAYAAHMKADERVDGGRGEEIDVIFLSPPWGGPEYLNFNANPNGDPLTANTYPLSALEPISGQELFELSSQITPNIAMYLPKNVNTAEVGNLARVLPIATFDGSGGRKREREWVEIEEEWVGDKLKAVTAYYGGLVDSS
ncbi:trimethylguanosine synthase, partial [Tremellales sp. Uapishka_1]